MELTAVISGNTCAAPAVGTARQPAFPLALKIAAVTLFFPVELSFYLFGLRLTIIRLLFLLIAPYLTVKFLRKLAAMRYRFVVSDLLMIFLSIWMIYAPASVDNLSSALNHAGPDVLEFCTAYWTTRILLSKHGQAVTFARMLCYAIALVAIIGLLDPLTGEYVVKDLVRQFTGFSDYLYSGDTHRMGLMRASGTIDHAILYGFLCSIGVLIAITIRIQYRRYVIAACFLGMVFALSSASWQTAILGIGFIAYARFTRGMPLQWSVLVVLCAFALLYIFTFSNSPLSMLIGHLTLDPQTGWYRLWTWDRVLFHLQSSPWCGLGFGTPPEDINHTIDSLWLVLAMRYGVPGSILTLLAMLGSQWISTRGANAHLDREEAELASSLGIVLFLTIFIAFTVHLWGSVWIFTGLLTGMRASLGELSRLSSRNLSYKNM
jgi:hypothetical protein